MNGYSLGQALTALRRLAGTDLGDYFRFVYIGHKQSLAGDRQPYADGYRVTFQTYQGTKKLANIGIDLVVGPGDLDDIEVTDPGPAPLCLVYLNPPTPHTGLPHSD